MRAFFSGGCSSVGRVPDCDSGCRGFEPHQSPQIFKDLGCLRAAFVFSGKHMVSGEGQGKPWVGWATGSPGSSDTV